MAKIAIVTDVHHGPTHGTKRGDAAVPLLQEFARFANVEQPDLVIDLGDRITDSDAETDRRLTLEVKKEMAAITHPLVHMNGDHDLGHLSIHDMEDLLEQPFGNKTVDIAGWRVLLWRADVGAKTDKGFTLAQFDLDWLRGKIRDADRPVLIASHVPLAGQSMVGNHYFENSPQKARYERADEIRGVLSERQTPVVCVSGHAHWNSISEIDGVTHLTQQSLVESVATEGEPSGAFGVIELGDKVVWRVMGRAPMRYEFTPSHHKRPSPRPAGD